MGTVIYSSPIFGPVNSRRLGVSLGINLMPSDGKICTFDCLYCECGLNRQRIPSLSRPSREEIRQALEERLKLMQKEGPEPNVLTFAGNGEPTAHPDFAGIIDDVTEVRDRYFPKAKVTVLSNGTRIRDEKVFNALMKVDNNIQKLDTVDIDYIRKLDRPTGRYDLQEVIGTMKKFNGHVIIQTMFLKGVVNGVDMDNTLDRYVDPWIEAIREIGPEKIMIYTIAREAPISELQKASPDTLDRIADKLRPLGIELSVSY